MSGGNKQRGGNYSQAHRKPIIHKPQPNQGSFNNHQQGFFNKKATQQEMKIPANAEVELTAACLLPLMLGAMGR